MLYLAQQYIDIFRSTRYDLEEYNILNGPITHCVFITPNANDQTLLASPILQEPSFKKVVIQDDEKLYLISNEIMAMHDETELMLA